MRKPLLNSRSGFTLAEIMVTIPLALLFMAGIYRPFKTQQDSYLIQDQVTVMQQNLRGAMYLITRDLLMAGYLSVLDTHPHTVNWDGKGGTANKRPIIIGRDNVHILGDDIKDHTDTIVIAKASDEGRSLKAGESATGEEVSLTSAIAGNVGASVGVQAKASGTGAATGGTGKAGGIVGRSYGSGIEVYRLTRTAIALGATIAGTKFWKDDSLN